MSHDPHLDEETFLQSTMGDARLARMIVDAYLQASPDLLVRCLECRDAGDLKEARRAIHTVKGSAMALGLSQLAQACQGVESRLDQGDLAIDHALGEVAALFESSRSALGEALARLEA